MNQREAKFWDICKGKLSPDVFYQRVENAAGDGDPDVLLMRDGIVRPVELKAVIEPVKATSLMFQKGSIRKSQINYHLRWAKHGGTSFVLLGTNKRVYLFHGHTIRELAALTVADCIQHSIITTLPEFKEAIFCN